MTRLPPEAVRIEFTLPRVRWPAQGSSEDLPNARSLVLGNERFEPISAAHLVQSPAGQLLEKRIEADDAGLLVELKHDGLDVGEQALVQGMLAFQVRPRLIALPQEAPEARARRGSTREARGPKPRAQRARAGCPSPPKLARRSARRKRRRERRPSTRPRTPEATQPKR